MRNDGETVDERKDQPGVDDVDSHVRGLHDEGVKANQVALDAEAQHRDGAP